jgi:hypothetical protein
VAISRSVQPSTLIAGSPGTIKQRIAGSILLSGVSTADFLFGTTVVLANTQLRFLGCRPNSASGLEQFASIELFTDRVTATRVSGAGSATTVSFELTEKWG